MIILLILLFLLLLIKIVEPFEEPKNPDPCASYLSDRDYLLHMIPHHQVAIDVSEMLRKKTSNPMMLQLLRELIWTQTNEIKLMKSVLEHFPESATGNFSEGYRTYEPSTLDVFHNDQSSIKNVPCDKHFFDTDEHMKHLMHIDLDEKYYLNHMMPHHQVAVDMSKRLLKHTKSDYMVYFCYRIIRSQQTEIWKMKYMLDYFDQLKKQDTPLVQDDQPKKNGLPKNSGWFDSSFFFINQN